MMRSCQARFGLSNSLRETPNIAIPTTDLISPLSKNVEDMNIQYVHGPVQPHQGDVEMNISATAIILIDIISMRPLHRFKIQDVSLLSPGFQVAIKMIIKPFGRNCPLSFASLPKSKCLASPCNGCANVLFSMRTPRWRMCAMLFALPFA